MVGEKHLLTHRDVAILTWHEAETVAVWDSFCSYNRCHS